MRINRRLLAKAGIMALAIGMGAIAACQPAGMSTTSIPDNGAVTEYHWCTDAAGEEAGTGSNNPTDIPEMIDGHPVPKEIAGYEVFWVEWSRNSLWMEPGTVALALMAKSDDPAVSRSDRALWDAVRRLPEGWRVSVAGGPGLCLDELVAKHEKQNELYRKYGPVRSGGPIR